jgi:hypothetical protein
VASAHHLGPLHCDAGLHWEIDTSLHLAKLDSRDW